MSLFGNPLAPPIPTGTGSGGAGGASPFAGAIASSFGFEIPTGDPGAIDQAATQASITAGALTMDGSGVQSASSTAVSGWQGPAEGAFVEYVGVVNRALQANSEALGQAAQAMSELGRELEHAQQVTRRAAQDCGTYQQQATELSKQATGFGKTADTLQAQAATAFHPQAQSELNRQAGIARGQQETTARAAGAAQGDFEAAQRRGIAAASAYQERAAALTRRISDAADRIRPVPRVRGGAPVPVDITPADSALASSLLPVVLSSRPADSTEAAAQDLRRLAGGPVTPGTVTALLNASGTHKEQQGNIIDALGGFVHTATLGAVGFGNPNTARYEGGSIAAMIPLDPDSLAIDADRGAARLAADGTERALTPEERAAAQEWRDGLPTKPTPSGTPAGEYEIAHTGDQNLLMQSGGTKIWADGFESSNAHILEAKYTGNPARSPFIDGSGAPDFVRDDVRSDVVGELQRYKDVINDPANPSRAVTIVTNDPRAVPTFERWMKEVGVPGRVVVEP